MSANRSARAGLQAVTGTGVRMAIQVVNLVVLARLLTPAEFGVYAMAMTVIGFASLFRDMGLSTAAVQAAELPTQTRDNLWWINTGVGAGLAAAAVAAAPSTAQFFHEPDVAVMMYLLAPTLLLSGATAQYAASLMRQVRFGVIALAETTGALVGLVLAIVLASNGAGIWALAVPQLAAGVLVLGGEAAAAGWLPMRPRRGHGTRTLFRFGATIFGSQILTYVHRNVDAVLMGRLHGAQVTGMFNRATQMTRMPITMLSGPFSSVALATMAPHQTDSTALARLAAKGQVLLALPVLTLAGGLIAAADPVVEIALGPGWQDAIPFVRLIAASEALALMASVGGWIITSQGIPDRLIRLSMISTVVKLTFVGVGSLWGPYGIVAGVLAAQVVLWPTSLALAGRFTGTPTRHLLIRSYLLVGVIGTSTAVGWAVGHWVGATLGPIGHILTTAAAMVGAVAFAALVIPAFRASVQTFFRTVRSGV